MSNTAQSQKKRLAKEYARMAECQALVHYDYPEAERLYCEAVRSDIDNPHYINKLGEVLQRQGKFDQARVAFEWAVELAPDNETYRKSRHYVDCASGVTPFSFFEPSGNG